MGRIERLRREFSVGGVKGVIKRGFYYIPNRYLIMKNSKKALRYGLNNQRRPERIVVSLTSFPPRFKNIHLCLKSLLLQTYQPDRIVVWLGSDSTAEMLTPEMKELEQYGIEYIFDEQKNLKSHKKYYYVMQEEKNAIIITVDDDSVYPENTVESLMRTHMQYPKCVCARRVHKIVRKEDGSIAPYKNWIKEYRKMQAPSNDLIAVGVGGVLYPVGCFDEKAFDINDFMELCPGTDDIWLKYMEVKNGIQVVWTPCFFAQPPTLEGIASLNDSNVAEGQNDISIHKMVQKYGDWEKKRW